MTQKGWYAVKQKSTNHNNIVGENPDFVESLEEILVIPLKE